MGSDRESICKNRLPLAVGELLCALFLLSLSSCSKKMECPAYRSAFIFDTTALKKKFSYFVNDTPKIYTVNKNKFLIIEPVSYRSKTAEFRTIEMLPTYPVIPDSLILQRDEQLRNELDSLGTAEAKPPLHPGLIGPKFNVEQENYMYYFRKTLVLPDVKGTMPTQKRQKKGIKGFFKGLFKKKDKKEKKERKKKTAEASAEPDATSADAQDAAPAEEKRTLRKKKTAEVDPNQTDPNQNDPNQNQEGKQGG